MGRRSPWFVVVAGAIAFLTALGFLAAHAWIAEIAASLRLQLAVAGVVAAVGCLLVRARLAVLLALVGVVVNVVVIAPHLRGEPGPLTGPDRFVVAHVNLQHRTLDEAVLRTALRERKPDLLFILEPQIRWSVGRPSFAGYRVVTDGSPKVSALVLARVAPRRAGRPLVNGLPGGALAVETTFAGAPLWALVMHGQAPVTPHLLFKRDRSLRAAASLARRHDGPRIVLGDFNATPWSYALERFERESGLVSSAAAARLQPSWPWFLGPLGLAIDQHFHSRDLVVADRSLGPTFGSTHRSLWVELGHSS